MFLFVRFLYVLFLEHEVTLLSMPGAELSRQQLLKHLPFRQFDYRMPLVSHLLQSFPWQPGGCISNASHHIVLHYNPLYIH